LNGFSVNDLVTKNGHALLVSSSNETISSIQAMLAPTGIVTLLAATDEQAYVHLKNQQISYILIESGVSDAPCNKFIRALRLIIGKEFIPIIILASTEDEAQLSYCMSAGCDDILFKPFTALALNCHISTLEKMRELKRLYKDSLNEQIVAKRIMTNAMDERSLKFEQIELLNRSKAIFSGDLFLAARHPDGSLNVMLADFTGHGLPSTIGSLPVADVFSTMTEKGFEPGYILENINNKLHTLLPTSMFMACSLLNISNDLKHIKFWNGGMPDIYVRGHDTGKIKHRLQSMSVPLGITETISNQYNLKDVELTPGDQLILFTDGLTESLDKEGDMFGEHRLEKCLEENHEEASIFTALINTFDEFRGDVVPMDDVTLVCIPCTKKLMHENNIDVSKGMHITCTQDDSWHWYLELGGTSMREMDPVQYVIDEIHKISGHSDNIDKLAGIMSMLYDNAIVQNNTEDNAQISNIHKTIKNRIDSQDMFIRIGIKKIYHNGIPALLIHMEDGGRQFSQDALLNSLDEKRSAAFHDEEYPLVFELNKLSRNKDYGNRLEAIIFEQDNRVNHYG